MLTRFLLWAVLLLLVGRAIRRFFNGIAQGAASPGPRARQRPPSPPDKGELMVRDPVCGTFVLPSRATSMRDRSGTHYFCSDRCREAYKESPRTA
jgi:uncharacterized protein